jgi:mannose-1-phosphate guanylyltransferase
MRAVVLVGGEGTRLRPLTETVPKPLLPLLDRRSLDHVLDHLARHGVHEVVLSSPYLASAFDGFIAARAGEPAITWITETEPLGTGGAVVHARDHLGDEPFFALNGDILTDLDLSAMAESHRDREADITIALHHVEDARAFGLVSLGNDGRVQAFREKPDQRIPGDVNAGSYLIDPAVLAPWDPGTPSSIERDIFPDAIAAGRAVYGFRSEAYWLDLGTPEKYLQAHTDVLAGRVHGLSYPAPWIGEGARVDPSAHLGRWVAVGPGAVVGAGANIEDSVILAGAVVDPDAHIQGTIMGFGSHVGAGATVQGSVFGEGAVAPAGSSLDEARVPPNTMYGATVSTD